MKALVQGNLVGIKNNILEALEGLYQLEVGKEILASPQLVAQISFLSYRIKREVAIYLNRRGRVVAVAVGDYGTVTLPEVRGRKDANRLSGIRCIHTHPTGGPQLSPLDLTSLANLKLDCMAAVEITDGEVGRIHAAYLQPQRGKLEREVMVVELLPSELEEHPFAGVVALIEKEIYPELGTTDMVIDRAILVSIERPGEGWTAEESLAELAELAWTAGAEVLEKISQKRLRPEPASFVGQGKARELGMVVQESGANCLIFDDELTPAQIRNLEVLAGCKILDRTSLILDIFASRAQSREGKIQVELAQLKHLLPRLTGLGTVLSRLGGGIGTRGPGETKLETDRRHIRRRISELERELEGVKKHRALQRTRRRAASLSVVSLVGYTNAGKSSLLNALTDSQVLAEDKLFATLDPVTRRLSLQRNQEILLTDTVGFVRKLPHNLVAAFRATLEEVVQAELLVHVVDASHPGLAEQIKAVEEVLAELGAGSKPVVMAFNKMDKLDEQAAVEMERMLRGYPFAASVSALTGEGLDKLVDVIGRLLPAQSEISALIPFERGDLLAAVHRDGQVKEMEYDTGGTRVKALVGPRLAALLKPFCVNLREESGCER